MLHQHGGEEGPGEWYVQRVEEGAAPSAPKVWYVLPHQVVVPSGPPIMAVCCRQVGPFPKVGIIAIILHQVVWGLNQTTSKHAYLLPCLCQKDSGNGVSGQVACSLEINGDERGAQDSSALLERVEKTSLMLLTLWRYYYHDNCNYHQYSRRPILTSACSPHTN